jgi:hypothetical protein
MEFVTFKVTEDIALVREVLDEAGALLGASVVWNLEGGSFQIDRAHESVAHDVLVGCGFLDE